MKIQGNILSSFLHKGASVLEGQVLLDFTKEGLHLLSSQDEDIGLRAFLPNRYFSEYEICRGIISDLKFFSSFIRGFYTEKVELSLKEDIMFIRARGLEVEIPLVLERYFKPLNVSGEPFQVEEFNTALLKDILKPLRLVKDEMVEFNIEGKTLYAIAGKLERIKMRLDLKKEVKFPLNFKVVLSDLIKVLNFLRCETVLFKFYDRFLEVDDVMDVEYFYYLKTIVDKKTGKQVSQKEVYEEPQREVISIDELEEKNELTEEYREIIEMFRRGGKKDEEQKEQKEEEDIW
jgi:hypothetical protein